MLICTAQDNGENLDRLERGLEELWDGLGPCPPLPAPFLPRRVLSPRQALFAGSRVERLARCEGAVAACQIAPYPPGVPVVAPGEEIGKKELAYLEKIGYNMMTEVRILSQ